MIDEYERCKYINSFANISLLLSSICIYLNFDTKVSNSLVCPPIAVPRGIDNGRSISTINTTLSDDDSLKA